MLVLAWLSALHWLSQAVMAWRAARALKVLDELPAPTRTTWPTLSIVVPARDEAMHLREALAAKLSDGYPALELVVVDDRSTDDTGAQARALASADPRVTVTRVDALPEGWLGKVNALQQGLSVARGEWILFSDADVKLAPDTLARVIAWAEGERVDHVVAFPSVVPGDTWTTICLAAFFRFVVTFSRLWAIERSDSKAAVGIGAFNLFRRSALERSPGLEWLKMEIADDVALGVMLKRAGARQRAIIARGAVSLQFYPSFRAMARALEKNGASAPLPQVLLGLSLMMTLELGWVAALTQPLGWAVYAFAVATGLGVARWLGNPRWPALLPGLGTVPLAAVLMRSALLAWKRGGVLWRGTFYPTSVVRAGLRMK